MNWSAVSDFLNFLLHPKLVSACFTAAMKKAGAYILEEKKTRGRGGNISRCHLGEKILKGEEKKGENVK